MKKVWKKESGSLIVEASIVFPIMFLVIFIMMFAGNGYLQKCRVESIVSREILAGAAYCADPILDQMESGTIPDYDKVELRPYRYVNVISGMDEVIEKVQGNIEKGIQGMDTGLFSSMKPESVVVQDVTFKNRIIYSNFSVDVSYRIRVPIRMLGEQEFYYMNFATRMDVPVTDVPEFIRNVDMIEDYVGRLTGHEAGEVGDTIAGKIGDLMGKVNEWSAKSEE